jgi:uncharacterized protein YfiM (DUF2279 family)
VEVLSEVHALAQAQWARQNAAKLLLASTFLTGAKMAMRQNHPLLKMEQLLFLLSGIAQDAVFLPGKIRTIHHHQSRTSLIRLT